MTTAGEKAMALVDGQLAPQEVPELVRELARNPPLVAELQEYLAMSRNRIAPTYAVKAEEAVPAWLIDAIMRAPRPVSPRPRQSTFARALPWLRSSYRIPAWSLAAGPALAAVAMLAVGLAALQPRHGGVLMDASLAAALEKTASGKDAPLATVRPVLSFNSKTGAWCRQFEVRHATRQVSHALACRGEDGHWTVMASTAPGAGGIAPAGADRRKTIDDLAAAMMRSEPLSQADEAQEIGKGWRHP